MYEQDQFVRPVFLILQGAGSILVFLAPPEFTDGYVNELETTADAHYTHPTKHNWKKGSVESMPLTLEIVAGVSYDIKTPTKLREVVQKLWDMSLPPPNKNYLEAVTVSITGQGHLWFQRKVFVEKANVKWSYPMDIQTGIYHKATISLLLTPTYVDAFSHEPGTLQRLPRRPYDFARG